MKTRLGFVSNSSSSSFICDVCGENYSGWDAGLCEAEMFKCEHGHIVCQEHALEEIDSSIEEDYPYEVSSKYCPICSFKTIEYTTAFKYLLKSLGKTEKQFLEELKEKFKSYEEYLEVLKCSLSIKLTNMGKL